MSTNDITVSNSILFYKKAAFDKQKVQNTISEKEGPIDYKNIPLLMKYISIKGRIIPRRISGVSRREQTLLSRAIKRARILGLLPFTTTL